MINGRFADLERRLDELEENLVLLLPLWLSSPCGFEATWIDLELPPAKVKAKEDTARSAKARSAKWDAKPSAAGSGASGGKSMSAAGSKLERLKGFAKGTSKGQRIAAGVGAGALAAGAGYAGYKALKGKGKDKAASAQMEFEDEACLQACKTASAAGYDLDEAIERVDSVQNLGLEETEKVAMVQDFGDAIHVRGLEYLEAAGYPVDWSEVFGE